MRLHGLDVARFLAFAGMVLVNFRIVAAPPDSADFGKLITQILEGRHAALFVVGMANMVIFDADILHFYALYFGVAALFVNASERHLLPAAVAILALSLLAMVLLDYDRGWDWDSLIYADFWTLSGFVQHSLFNGWHPVFPWAAFLLVGMWLGRKPLQCRRFQLRLLAGGTAVALTAAILGHLPMDPELRDILGTSPIPPGPFYVLGGIGSSAALIGAILLISPALQALRLADWLAAPGRQTLTLYVAHIMLGMGAMQALGWMNGALSSPQVFWGSLAFCGLAALYARIWGLIAKRGPLEFLMRAVTEPAAK